MKRHITYTHTPGTRPLLLRRLLHRHAIVIRSFVSHSSSTSAPERTSRTGTAATTTPGAVAMSIATGTGRGRHVGRLISHHCVIKESVWFGEGRPAWFRYTESFQCRCAALCSCLPKSRQPKSSSCSAYNTVRTFYSIVVRVVTSPFNTWFV